jgi:hypothetical protein
MRKLITLIIMLTAITTGVFALTVQGTVMDSETGEGIEGATVRFIYLPMADNETRGNGNGNGNGHGQGNGGGNGYNVFTTVTDAEGTYILENLSEGSYIAMARKKTAYPSIRIDVELTEDAVVDFELVPASCEPQGRFNLFMGRKLK